MSTAIAEPEERFASMVRAGAGTLELGDTVFGVHLAALHAGRLVLGIACDTTAAFSSTSARVSLYDVVGADELGPAAPALLAPPSAGRGTACGRDCPGGCPAPGAGTATHLVRLFAEARGRVGFPDPIVERALALDLADHTPHPALLAVGNGIRLACFDVTTLDLVDHLGCARIDPADLELAAPDPFCDIEAVWLARLNDPRSAVIQKMVDHLQRRGGRERLDLSGVPGPIAATALDRFGVTLAARDATGARRHWRIGFAGDCAGVEDLAREIRALCGECAGDAPGGGSLLRGRDVR